MFIPNLLSAESGGETTLRARIVIVEDEPDLRDAVAEYLGANGYRRDRGRSAAAMRALAETRSFHLAILDIAMPGEDGLSLGRWLRSQMPIGIIYATAAGTVDRPHRRAGTRRRRLHRQALRIARAAGAGPQRAAPRAAAEPTRRPARRGEGDAPRRRIVSFGDFHADLDGRMVTGPTASSSTWPRASSTCWRFS